MLKVIIVFIQGIPYTHQKIIRLYTEQVPKVSERDRRVRLETELGVVVRWRVVAALVGEVGRLYRHEVLHQQVALWLRRQPADGLLDACGQGERYLLRILHKAPGYPREFSL